VIAEKFVAAKQSYGDLKHDLTALNCCSMRCKCGKTIPDREILAEAGRIRSGMRKTHRGPMKLHLCPRCGAECIGLTMLRAHLSLCEAAPCAEVTPADMAAMAWTPDDAA
jgi:hypothetical protein